MTKEAIKLFHKTKKKNKQVLIPQVRVEEVQEQQSAPVSLVISSATEQSRPNSQENIERSRRSEILMEIPISG